MAYLSVFDSVCSIWQPIDYTDMINFRPMVFCSNIYLDLMILTAVSFDDYCKILPPITELVGLYGVSVPVAMHIIRPILNNAVLVSHTLF